MALSKDQIETLIGLVDSELKSLESDQTETADDRRIPGLEACRLELVTLAAADRARRKKAFPDMLWRRGGAATPPGPLPPAAAVDAPFNRVTALRKPE